MAPRKNPSGAGNAQGSPSAIDIAWLAGIFDGEGWIGLNRARRTNSRHLRYSASAIVTTTSPKLAAKIHALMDVLEVRHYFIEIDAKKGSDGSWRRRKWNIAVSANKQTEVFLLAIRPYLIEKDVQADLVLDYIEWRKTQPTRPGGHNQPVILGMKERAEETIRLLTEDRTRYDPSTTTRLASAIAG